MRVREEDDSPARLVSRSPSPSAAPVLREPLTLAVLGGVLLVAACATATGSSRAPGIPSLSDWPPNARPDVVGKRVAENFLARPLDFETGGTRTISNSEAMTWYGALRVAKLTHDTVLQRRLVARFEPLKRPGHPNVSLAHHLDASIFGAVPLEIFMQTGDSACLRLGLGFADRQWENPTPEGYTTQARWWIDDMYMISLIQLQAYRATRDSRYLDRNARLMAAYLDSLQRPSGLFYHGPGASFYWGRANGWIAAALAEVLTDLPPVHPQYRRIMAGYTRMMPTALAYQSPEGTLATAARQARAVVRDFEHRDADLRHGHRRAERLAGRESLRTCGSSRLARAHERVGRTGQHRERQRRHQPGAARQQSERPVSVLRRACAADG